MMKYIINIGLLLFLSINVLQAQFTQADIAVNGLTCSQCSRSVEMSLKRLDFVAAVEMNLQQPTAHIIFKKDKKIDFSKLASAVKDAGFAVRSIQADYQKKEAVKELCFVDNRQLYFPVNNDISTQKNIKILLLGKGMISDGELKKQQSDTWLTASQCSTTVSKKVPFLILK